mmetsp:Transcript_12110/g.21014  ORF Transcript_12110/g.21014 Transcript_12110/m.21014 type:complete len:144 (-) Transcript_12110:87-518(-)
MLLVATMPLLWIMLDLAVENLILMQGWDAWWLFWLISGVGWWMGSFPTCFAAFLYSAKALRKQRRYRLVDWLMNFAVIGILLPVFVVTFVPVTALAWFSGMPHWQTAILSSAVHILTAALMWNAPAILKGVKCQRQFRTSQPR